jgi:flagellar biosynthesis/type III secretory pathway M-ring protein FliF/YscJ
MDAPSTSIGPGLGAFIAFFLLAVVLWLLMRNMNGRMRRMAYKEQQRVADLEAREEAGEGAREQAKEEARGAGTAERTGTERPKDQPASQPAQDADKADPAP